MSDEPEFSWTAIADQCRRFVCAHDDQHVDATILGSLLGSLRVVAGLPAVFPGDPTGIDRAARIDELRRLLNRQELGSIDWGEPGPVVVVEGSFIEQRLRDLEAQSDA